MFAIDIELLETSLNKLKFYHNECLLNIDLLKQNINIKNSYKTKNTEKIEEYQENMLKNLKTINNNFDNNIIVLEKNLFKYLNVQDKTKLIFENIGDNDE